MTIAFIGLFAASNLAVIGVVTILIGTFAPGAVPLIFALVHEMLAHHPAQQNVAWTRASVISAASLAVTAYGFSALFNATGGNHRVLFAVSAAMLIVALLAGFIPTTRSRRSAHG